MARINCIREMYFEKGMSYASIAKTTGHDVKTVKKYIQQEDFNLIPQPVKKRRSKLDGYKGVIDSWLEEDKKIHRKQRHTALKVFTRLKEEKQGFNCSYRLVAAYVAEKKRTLYNQENQFFMPLVHIPGEAQADFGRAVFYERSEMVEGYSLNLSFPNSNGSYVQLFKGKNRQCLAEGLINIFNYLGGVQIIWHVNKRSFRETEPIGLLSDSIALFSTSPFPCPRLNCMAVQRFLNASRNRSCQLYTIISKRCNVIAVAPDSQYSFIFSAHFVFAILSYLKLRC